MFLPLHDDTPLKVIRFQTVTGLIIAANVAAFLYTHYALGGTGEVAVAMELGATPALITESVPLDHVHRLLPDLATLFTYMFVHANWMHLLGNMAFLWVFADNVEDAFGHGGFLFAYLAFGVVAGLAYSYAAPYSQSPLIGASGAVAGVMGAYLVLFPRARVWILLFMRLPLRISAAWVLIGWLALQFLSLLTDKGDSQMSVGWWAHIGGFVSGLAVTWLLRGRLRRRLAA